MLLFLLALQLPCCSSGMSFNPQARFLCRASRAGATGSGGGPTDKSPCSVNPVTVCRGDKFRTRVELDATISAPAGRAPGSGSAGLAFRWEFSSSTVRFISGKLTSDKLVVGLDGDSPVKVTLHATDTAGNSGFSSAMIGLTQPTAVVCKTNDDCPTKGEGCRTLPKGERRCLPTGSCKTEQDCPPCYICKEEGGSRFCAPPSL